MLPKKSAKLLRGGAHFQNLCGKWQCHLKVSLTRCPQIPPPPNPEDSRNHVTFHQVLIILIFFSFLFLQLFRDTNCQRPNWPNKALFTDLSPQPLLHPEDKSETSVYHVTISRWRSKPLQRLQTMEMIEEIYIICIYHVILCIYYLYILCIYYVLSYKWNKKHQKQAILAGLRTILTNRCCLGAILREIRSNFLVQRHKSFVVLPDFGIRRIRTLPGLALTERALAFTGLSED